jgi:hypothetical protein
MKLVEIERVKMEQEIQIPTDELSQSTLSSAKELLGYSPNIENLAKSNEIHIVLAELGIEILNWRQVLLYQADAYHQARLEELQKATKLPSSRSWHWKDWQQTKLADWKQPIPLHVIEKANQIKKRLPNVEFFVESLSENPDPFLVAKLVDPQASWRANEYFIEVWEEPKFER